MIDMTFADFERDFDANMLRVEVGETIRITQEGHPAVVIMPYRDYLTMQGLPTRVNIDIG